MHLYVLNVNVVKRKPQISKRNNRKLCETMRLLPFVFFSIHTRSKITRNLSLTSLSKTVFSVIFNFFPSHSWFFGYFFSCFTLYLLETSSTSSWVSYTFGSFIQFSISFPLLFSPIAKKYFYQNKNYDNLQFSVLILAIYEFPFQFMNKSINNLNFDIKPAVWRPFLSQKYYKKLLCNFCLS